MPIVKVAECDFCKSRGELRVNESGNLCVPKKWYIVHNQSISPIVVCGIPCLKSLNRLRKSKGLKAFGINMTTEEKRDRKLNKLGIE